MNYSLVPTKDVTPPNFTKKTFTNSHKTLKFAKALSLESFPLYSNGYIKFRWGGGGGGNEATILACLCVLCLHAFLTCLLVARAISMMLKRSCNPFAN